MDQAKRIKHKLYEDKRETKNLELLQLDYGEEVEDSDLGYQTETEDEEPSSQ